MFFDPTMKPETKTMDPALKAKWVEALRNGGFKQTEGQFFDDELQSFCVLGVLCAVGGQPPLKANLCGNWAYVNGVLPAKLEGHDAAYFLSDMNDNGASFPEIAAYIEANL